MPQQKIVIYTDDFKPKLGGIAEYSFHLARGLHKEGLLAGVITPVVQNEAFEFPVYNSEVNRNRKVNERFGDQMFLLRKLNSLTHSLLINYYVFADLFKYKLRKKGNLILFTAYFDFYLHRLMVRGCKRLQLPYGIVFHGLDLLGHNVNCQDDYLATINGAEFLIFNSQATQKLFFELHPDVRKRNYVLNPGLDFDAINACNQLPLSHFESITGKPLKNRLIMSCIAHLRERKGVSLGIRIVAELVREYPDLCYIIGGEGPEFQNLEEQIISLGLQQHVFLLGRLNDSEKYSLLNHSSIFLMPTRSLEGQDFEGFGISFLEASFFGNVVLGGRSGGEQEAIMEGVSGFTFDNDSEKGVGELKEKLFQILKDGELRKKLQENGKGFVSQKYSWKKLIPGFVKFFLENGGNN